MTELGSAGVLISDGEIKTSSSFFGGGGGSSSSSGVQNASTSGGRGRDVTFDGRGQQRDDTLIMTDLEGGSRRTLAGRVPTLVVGNKEDVGESMRGAGSTLACELGAGHVSVVREGASAFPLRRMGI